MAEGKKRDLEDEKNFLILRKYYSESTKTGSGPPSMIYRGSRMQRGSGLGSIIGSIFKSPIVRRGLKYGAKAALSTGGDLLSNIDSGDNFKTAAKKSFSKQQLVQKRKAVEAIKRMVRPRKPVKKGYKKLNRRKKRADNFGTLDE